tara:strand:+ start:483 stop:710 length:228 start_codon:yes stop_codon:yes gene_type:complete
MKTKEEINKKIGELTHTETSKLDYIIKSCERIKNRLKVDEDTIKDLSNMYAEIYILKENLTRRLIKLLKQDHMIN